MVTLVERLWGWDDEEPDTDGNYGWNAGIYDEVWAVSLHAAELDFDATLANPDMTRIQKHTRLEELVATVGDVAWTPGVSYEKLKEALLATAVSVILWIAAERELEE